MGRALIGSRSRPVFAVEDNPSRRALSTDDGPDVAKTPPSACLMVTDLLSDSRRNAAGGKIAFYNWKEDALVIQSSRRPSSRTDTIKI